jgi:hypothetical protein
LGVRKFEGFEWDRGAENSALVDTGFIDDLLAVPAEGSAGEAMVQRISAVPEDADDESNAPTHSEKGWSADL